MTCHTCNGDGAKPGTSKTCSYCNGAGHVSVEQNTILGRVRTQQTCPKCDGTGQDSKNHAQLVMVKVQKIKQLN